jgi:cytochrome b involved in lipid metabolism
MSPPFARNVLEDATALPRRGLFSISKVTDHKPDKKAPAKSKNDPLKRFERASTAVTRSDKPIVVTIEGKRVELTDWAKAHPGGVKILERFHGKDATAAFHSVRHSPHAYALLELLASVSDDGSAQAAVASARARSGFLAQLRCKLFSKEDPIGVHKYLGLFCLLHFVFRYYQMLLGDPSAGLGSRLGQGPSWIAPFCLVPHAALSLSSLIFHSVPRERVVGKPMIWQEYRIHNIAFAMRSVMTALFGHLSIRHGHAPAWRHVAVSASCAIVLATNVVVDAATACLRADEAESTTATMPYWEGCSIRTQKRFKTFYAYCQFMV